MKATTAVVIATLKFVARTRDQCALIITSLICAIVGDVCRSGPSRGASDAIAQLRPHYVNNFMLHLSYADPVARLGIGDAHCSAESFGGTLDGERVAVQELWPWSKPGEIGGPSIYSSIIKAR